MSESVDVTDFMDSQRISWFQITVVLVCSVIQYFDGFDWLAIAYVGPSLTSEWQISHATLGAVFGAGVFGVALGTLAIGPLADIIGRRWLTIGAVAFFGVWSVITAFATAPWQLMPLRFITGLGTWSRHTELHCAGLRIRTATPPRHHGHRCRLRVRYRLGHQRFDRVSCHSPVRLAGFVHRRRRSSSAHGCRTSLLASRIHPVSRRQAGQQSRACPYLQKINPRASLPHDVTFVLADEQVKVRGVSHLFQGGNARITPIIWCMFFFQLLVVNFLNSWLPSVSHSAGFALSQALQVATSYQFGGILGIIGLGVLADRFGFYRILGTAFVSGAVVVALMPFALFSATVSVAVFSVAGFFVIGNAQLLNAFAASIYPTPVRSTGTSWALGVGRFGSTAGPLLGGILIGLPWPFPPSSSPSALFRVPLGLALS